MPSNIDNVLIQVRSRLQEQGIKLWLAPYYFEDIGPVESELENLAKEFSEALRIPQPYCKAAISELQDGALSKLRARKEFRETGLATIKVRAVQDGRVRMFNVKCYLTDVGNVLHQKVADELNVRVGQVKLISSGKVVQYNDTLLSQGINNNHQIMALISSPPLDESRGDIYDRVRKAKEDAELIIASKRQNFLTMEDQDGNAVYLPPKERKSILLALALYEKGRAAMKKDNFDEALVLYLEADEQFSTCSSTFLDSVDNYALLNLDIVWCYLCLKSVTHLPDAERRLRLCEESFQKSYGENLKRVMAVKGNIGNERALILRLHLLQGVVLFHQNRRNESYEKLSVAEEELRSLKVDEHSLVVLIEMGYDLTEARIALRACGGNIDDAVCYITDRRAKKQEARQKTRQEHELMQNMDSNSDENWVNPRSVCALIEMGYPKELVIAALKKSKNDLPCALDLLQNHQGVLIAELPVVSADSTLVEELTKIGFDREMVKIALESTSNNSQVAIDLLLKLQKDNNFNELVASLMKLTNESNTTSDEPGPSRVMHKENDVKTTLRKKLKKEVAAMQAYERFTEGITAEEDEYLDIPLIQEENILREYKTLLEQ